MVVNRKVTGRAVGMPAGLTIGAVASLLVTIVGAGIVAWMLSSEHLQVESVGYGSMVILFAASTVGAILSNALIKHRRLVVCLTSGGIYYFTLLAITALFFGGQFQGMGVTLAVVLAGVGSVGLLTTKKKKSITKGYRKLKTG